MYVFAFALLLLALLASLGGGGLALLQLWQGREDSLRIVEKAHVVISGALLIGHSESLHNISRAFQLEHHKGTIVYRKMS